MALLNWFKRKTDQHDLLHEARMESLRKKTQVADEIIALMNGGHVERRIVSMYFDGQERRNA